MYVLIFKFGKGNSVATYWEKAAYSAYDMISWFKCLNVNFVFPHLDVWRGFLFLIVPQVCATTAEAEGVVRYL